jgi:methylated-DNA-[protein]-cysteine S-methyltransferase
MITWTEIDSPIGKLRLLADGDKLVAIEFEDQHSDRGEEGINTILRDTREQLAEYFIGKRQRFDIPLGAGGTEFQHSVWNALVEIPYGRTCSYGDIAKKLDKPKAVRAVGAANGKNPIPIIVPCHRVIGANGKLTGFAGGLDIKERLLSLEGISSIRD